MLFLTVAGAGGSGRVVLRDRGTARAHRGLHDVALVELTPADGLCKVRVLFREPLVQGTYECVHVGFDCDNNTDTGLAPVIDCPIETMEGCDLWIRAAVGSRFRRSSAKDPSGERPAPMGLLRSAYSNVKKSKTASTGSERVIWQHQAARVVSVPVVAGRELRFAFPLSLLADHGLRYNADAPFVVVVEGSISDAPISLE